MAYVTKLLEQAIAQVRELPEEQQDAVAANLIYVIDNALNCDDEPELSSDRSDQQTHI